MGEGPKSLRLGRKDPLDLALEDGEIVGESKRGLPGRAKSDPGLLLLAKLQFAAIDPELSQRPGQPGAFFPRPAKIRHRVQTNVKLAPGDAVKAVQASGNVVALEN